LGGGNIKKGEEKKRDKCDRKMKKEEMYRQN
jgi:hypothetical protein